MATCPECDAEIEIDEDDLKELQIGDPWDCDGCGSRLRLAVMDPLEFDADDDDDDDDAKELKGDGEESESLEDLEEDDDDDDEDEEWEE